MNPLDRPYAPAVYLCQVREGVSCGACCGLYNQADLSPESLEARLAGRTAAFARVPRTVEAIDAFGRAAEGWTPATRPFADFHHCPFLGLAGAGGKQVGCLLHPEAPGNGGVDWRGLSYYGGMACRTYFCPATRHLPPAWLAAVGQSMEHWYLHGLIVTERCLLEAFFQEIEGRIGRPVRESDFAPGSPAAALLRAFAALKIDWPHRRADAPGPCNYFFENGAYPRPEVLGWGPDRPASRFAAIFRELDSAFASPADLRAAEARLEELFRRIAAALVPGCGVPEVVIVAPG